MNRACDMQDQEGDVSRGRERGVVVKLPRARALGAGHTSEHAPEPGGWIVPDAGSQEAESFAFGPFVLIPAQQKLLLDGKAVRIRGRALEILALLVARPGEVLEKRELIAAAWPNIFVDESNLKVNVAALRRALGDGHEEARYIATVAGRGYRFVAPVRRLLQAREPERRSVVLPMQLSAQRGRRLIGRAEVVAALRSALAQERLLTIVGPGGIGKTSVALAVAAEAADMAPDGTVFIDLSPLAEARFIPAALASALGLPVHSEQVVPALTAHMQGRSMLIVLDCCEHLIEPVALLAEDILAATATVRILATSREPLSIAEERVYRLPALETPASSAALTAQDAMTYSSVQLFVERAAARLKSFELTDANAWVAAAICQRLDGMALAIELAATRVDIFSLPELLALLNDRFRLLKEARRSRLPRQRSLAATLDWSYGLLSQTESRILRGLSVFTGPFTLDAATAILTVQEQTAAEVSAGIASLVAKSLVQSDVSDAPALYRLLDSTRIYAKGHLLDAEESELVIHRHAGYFRGLAERSEDDWGKLPTDKWLARYGRAIDDVRGALGWAFSDAGNIETGIALTVAAIPLWEHLSLIDECRSAVERALGDGAGPLSNDHRSRMKLSAALATALLHTRGPLPVGKAAWSDCYEIARQLAEPDFQLRALWGLCDYATWTGDHRGALAAAEKIRELAAALGDTLAVVNVDRQAGTALRYLGRHAEARSRLEGMIANYEPPLFRSHIARFQFDPRVGARGTLANVLWLQGFPDQAADMAERALREAEAAGHAMALCNALAHTAVPVALYRGDLEMARRLLSRLDEHMAMNDMAIWKAVANALNGALLIGRADDRGIPTLLDAIETMREAGFRMRYPAYLSVLAAGLTQSGETARARQAIDEGTNWARRSGEIWCISELWRVEGELFRREGTPEAAEDRFRKALRWARRQGARSLELRAATSLARLHRDLGRSDEGASLLAQVRDRFEEGRDTADLVAARDLDKVGPMPLLA